MLQHQLSGDGSTVYSAIRDWSAENECSGLWIAAAYATVSGTRLILDLIRLTDPAEINFLIGIDDHITQPEALKSMRSFPGATLRVASLQEKGARFHPKAYYFRSTRGHEFDLCISGSSNLTYAALNTNCEVNSIVPGDQAYRVQFFEIWKRLWRVGAVLSDEALSDYVRTYRKARQLRARIEQITASDGPPAKHKVALKSDDTEIEPSEATICWIECGFITLMGRELEFKAEQALFFGLHPQGAADQRFEFVTSAGNVAKLRMKFQGNHMWRLQLNDEVPEVKDGLRPLLNDGTLGRSPYVAVFARTGVPGRYDVRFIELNSQEFRNLKKTCALRGAIGRTSAREYGWV